MQQRVDLSIIIVNYNTTEFLKKCLSSVIENTKNIEYEIIVVDNNSIDRSIESTKHQFDSVKFFLRNINDGFGSACNYGVKRSKGKYILFLNPDIIIDSNVFLDFFNFMENNTNIYLCSGILTDLDGSTQYSFNNFPSISWEFSEAILRNTGKKIQNMLRRLNNRNNKFFKIDWVIGACMFTRKDIYDSVNGFDESFFLYYEDVDLQFRINKTGNRIVILPDLKLRHFQKSSVETVNGSDIYFYNMHKSKLKYMHKHFSFIKRNIVRLIYISGMILRLLMLPFRLQKPVYSYQQILNILKIYILKSD